MIRLALILLSLAAPVRADDLQRFRGAYEAFAADPAAAQVIADRVGPVAADVIRWHALREGEGALADYASFVARRPQWPGLARLRRVGEATLSDATPASEVLDYFQDSRPQTAAGLLALVRALRATGGDADAALIASWTDMALSEEEQAQIWAVHGAVLKPHLATRADRLMFDGRLDEARLLQPLWGDDLGLTQRLALVSGQPGGELVWTSLPKPVDAGMAHARMKWLMDQGRWTDAAALMASQSRSAEALGRPDAWVPSRRKLVRDVLRDGDAVLAYELAANNYSSRAAGYGFADLEWLAGYIALRRLNAPDLAVEHFERFLNAVDTPISLGRGQFWLGEALTAMGQADAAKAAYAKGAEFQTSYYGLLAAGRIGAPLPEALRAPPALTPEAQESDLVRAMRLGEAAGWREAKLLFASAIGLRGSRAQIETAADILLSDGQYNEALWLAKQAVKQGELVPQAYHPLHPLAQRPLPVNAALALGIARQESEFRDQATSRVGASGLMQLMPGTARSMSRKLNLTYTPRRLATDWKYNALLGAAYLSDLRDRFGPTPVMVAAGYNAGPGRVDDWITRFGDPRGADVDVIDWVEMIPFDETRNYVMRVTEGEWLYQARLGEAQNPAGFHSFLTGAFPILRPPPVRPDGLVPVAPPMRPAVDGN